MEDRFKDAEKLAAATREKIPGAAVLWLAALRKPLEKLTMAAVDPDLSDEDFRALVEKFAKDLPRLMDELDHDELAKLMEDGMGAAMANGISQRSAVSGQREENRAKLPWETDVMLGGNKKRDRRGRFASHDGGGDGSPAPVKIRESVWQGTAREMHRRAAEMMRGGKTLQHPASGAEMKVTEDGIRKTLHGMRTPAEFMAAAHVASLYLHSRKAGEGEQDRKQRRGIQAFHRFEAQAVIGGKTHKVEIITKELSGQEAHHLKQLRIKK